MILNKMRIGILYICTGKYNIFWKEFYLSCEKYFIPDAEKHYFVFTDSPEIEFEKENKNITRIYQENLGWPNNTLLRYKMFLKIKEEINKTDYLFFFNANILFIKTITPNEFLPHNQEKLVGCLHSGFYYTNIKNYPYETNPLSTAILTKEGNKHYYQGAINGGETEYFVKTIETLDENIKKDFKNNIIAKWHDESHWNHYLNNNLNVVKTISPSYLYPEGKNLPYEPKILMLGKDKYFGGLNQIRNLKQNINISYLKQIIKKIKNKLIYMLFSFYDNVFCSYFFISNFKNKKTISDSRKISVAITSYNREKIIYKSLKNIISDDRIEEIIILDDGSNLDSFNKTKEILARLSNKIKLFRREKNLGVLTTKIQAVELCVNDWVILLDSDNTINKSYLNSLYNINEWEQKTIYCPAIPIPLLDFRSLSKIKIDFEKIKELLIKKTVVTENLLNDGNFFFNKNRFLELMKKYEFFNPKAADIIFINYIWLSNNGELFVLPKASYLHRIHKMSTWMESSTQSSIYFEELKNKILMSEKENFIELGKKILNSTSNNKQIIKII